MGTFTTELIFGEYAYGTMTETPNISYKTLLYNGFSPLSLFAASEPGFWFDPSDISTLFQDAAGTTPVTAAGQSVGLVLDKSKGLVLGPELWASQTPSVLNALGTVGAYNGATKTMTNTGATVSSHPRFQFNLGLITGAFYKVAIQFSGLITKISTVRLATSGFANVLSYNSATGMAQGIVAAGSNFLEVLTDLTSTDTSGITIESVTVRKLPGNHATQSTSLSRPTYQIDSNGRGYLLFDGSDDFLVTPTITPGTDKAQVFAGVRKLSDAAREMLVEWGNAVLTGKFGIEAPNLATQPSYYWITTGSLNGVASYTNAAVAAPTTNVLTGIGEIPTDTSILRVNGAQAATSANDQGTGNYSAQPCYIGRRGGVALPFNGRIYSLICRFGPNLTADQIAQTETWVNSKTGAY